MYQVRLFIHGSYFRIRLDERSAAWYLSLAADEPERLRRLAALLEETARRLETGSGWESAPVDRCIGKPAKAANPDDSTDAGSDVVPDATPDAAEWEILVRLLDALAAEPGLAAAETERARPAGTAAGTTSCSPAKPLAATASAAAVPDHGSCSPSSPTADPRLPPPDGVWSIENAIHYINLHFSQAFSVDFFVDKCALNAGDFSRRFKQLAGCPLFEYINRQRVRRACVLLKSSSSSILQIADQVGYNNLSFFNRYFLRIMGCSPREYRSRSG